MIYLYGALLFAFWLLLSGHYDPLLISLGAASVVLTVFLSKRMDILDRESFPLHLALKLPRFFVYIFVEIIKSNIDVLQRTFSWRGKSVSPRMIEIDLPQKTDLGRVIYANSITLTPGTVSVELTDDSVIVHALSNEVADSLATGEMARAVPDGGRDQ